ncbi:MAG TPA: nuclear transport factor 2 family protein [Solirubrobacteraceae bacterium]|nr:nuclear transport factor 2 family protein [Solirubrobacteraceae bacterium]
MRFLAPALVLLVLVGCGDAGPTPEEQVRTTVSEFGKATAAKDYKTMCGRLLAPALVEDVEQIGLPCERALKQGLDQVREPRLTIGAVKIDGDSATAEVRTSAAGEEPSKDTLKLVNVNGTWKIASLGS